MALLPEKLAYFKSIGPAAVKREIAEAKHGQAPDSPLWREAELWVESELIRLASVSDTRRDAREEETLVIARTALANSRRANQIAIAAAILAATATICAVYIAATLSPHL